LSVHPISVQIYETWPSEDEVCVPIFGRRVLFNSLLKGVLHEVLYRITSGLLYDVISLIKTWE